MSTDKTLTMGPHAICACGWSLPLDLDRLHGYFDGEMYHCDRCNETVDWFEAMNRTSDFVLSTFSVVGAHTTHFPITLKPGEVKEVDFLEKIEESDVRILFVNYTSQGGREQPPVFAIEHHGNSPHRRRYPKVRLLGWGAANAPETNVGVSFTWIPRSKDDASWESLVDAYEALHEDDFDDVIVPANVAIELRLGRFLSDLIRSRAGLGQERIEQFLKEGATYGHQLGVVLPLVCALANLPTIPERVNEGLKQLHKQRNALAHTGTPRGGEIKKAEAIKMAVSAVLGCLYIDYLRKRAGLDAT